jgi:serine acetyltransferase
MGMLAAVKVGKWLYSMTKDAPVHAVVAGVPAKVIRTR